MCLSNLNIDRRGIKINTILVILPIVLFYFTMLLFVNTTMVSFLGLKTDEWYSSINKVIYILLILKIICKSRFTRINVIAIIGVLLIIFLSFLLSNNRYFVYAILFIIAMDGVKEKRVIKAVLITLGTTIVLIVYLSSKGIIPNIIQNKYLFDFDVQTLGFTTPNICAGIFLEFWLCWLYVRYKYFKVFDLIPFFIVWYVIDKVTYSRTSLYLLVASGILVVLAKILENIDRITLLSRILYIYLSVPMIISFVTLYLCKVNDKNMDSVNTLLSGRLSLISSYVAQYGLSLFGNSVEVEIAFDNAYIRCAVCYGLLVLIIFILGMIILGKKAMDEKNYALQIILLIYATQGIFESFTLFLQYNFTILLFSKLFFDYARNAAKTRKIINKEYMINESTI